MTGVTTGVEAAMVSFRAAVTLLAVLSESLTVTLKEEVPLAEGVPLMAPLVESANPAGKVPEARLHVYGEVPPLAASATE